jgi:putative oxidoreductase
MKPLPQSIQAHLTSAGLLLLRLVFGGFMLFGHGWSKLMNFSLISSHFPDPIGIGSTMSLVITIISEVVFSAFVMVGFKTRLATIPMIVTMAVAAFIIHGQDTFFMGSSGASKEPALLFLTGYCSILLMGGGLFSVDTYRKKKTEIASVNLKHLQASPSRSEPSHESSSSSLSPDGEDSKGPF